MDQDLTRHRCCTSHPHPRSKGASANSVADYIDLFVASPTSHPNQPFLKIGLGEARKVVTVSMLVSGFRIMLDALVFPSQFTTRWGYGSLPGRD